MSTFAVTKDNDLAVTGGQLTLLSGRDATLALAKHYAQTLRGEMMHAMTDGVRFFETAYNQPRLALFAHDMRNRIMQVDGVLAVRRFDARLSEDELIYTAEILTRWGAGEIGNIPVNTHVPVVGSGAKCRDDATLFGFYIEDGELIFYSDNDAGVSPRMYIDDDGYLILESQ